jgi:cell division protein FtsN
MAVAIGIGSEMKRWARTAPLVLILILIGTKTSLSQSQPATKQSSPGVQQATGTPDKVAGIKPAQEDKAATGGVSGAANPSAADDAPKLSPEKQRARDQLTRDTARLYELANELKTEMNKSTKDTLSLNVIRKADEVEKLAKKVRAEMQANIGN